MSDDVLYQGWVRELTRDLAEAESRALKYEQALREVRDLLESWNTCQPYEMDDWTVIINALDIARAALDKPGTEAMDEVIEYVNCPKCGGRAVSVTRKSAALDKPS